MENLMTTGIGRVLNNLSNRGGSVKDAAEKLVLKWKCIVVMELINAFYSSIEN